MMTSKNWPLVTLLVIVAMMALQYGPLDHALLYVDRAALGNGEFWRLLSGHVVHADTEHLRWNLAAFLVLGVLLERVDRKLFVMALVIGVIAVDVWLLGPFAGIERYCGFSGVLNSLLIVVLWQRWQQTRQRLLPALALLALAKILVEWQGQQALFTDIGWPPYPPAHLVGHIAGLLFCAAASYRGSKLSVARQVHNNTRTAEQR